MTAHRIITCPEWEARQPKAPAVFCPASVRFIFHHTAGHHPEIGPPNGVETEAEAMAYARAIQTFHMDGNGWNDSGHNFLVCRNGSILQGRWRTVSAIQGHQPAGRMVVSAHCPGQNEQVGIEHEHLGTEPMTAAQFEATAWLHAWVCAQYKRPHVLPIEPHSRYFATSCPGTLLGRIPAVHERATEILRRWDL